MNNLILIVVALVVLGLLMQNKREGYTTVNADVYRPYGKVDPYYIHRAYSHKPYPCNVGKLKGYPYNYQPKAYHKRYVKYNPQFYMYGYGHY